MVLRGIVKGKTIELDAPLPFPEGEAIRVTVERLPANDVVDAALLAVKEPPHLSREDIEAFNRSLNESRLPMSEGGIFDEEAA